MGHILTASAASIHNAIDIGKEKPINSTYGDAEGTEKKAREKRKKEHSLWCNQCHHQWHILGANHLSSLQTLQPQGRLLPSNGKRGSYFLIKNGLEWTSGL